jgi:DNA topoisomerase-1
LGRFGPYVVHDQGKDGKDYRSLKAGDDVLTISLARALELLAEPKKSRGGRSAAKPLRELGAHPEDAEPVNVLNGPYGLYVKHGKTNVGLPEGESVETMTLEKALELLSTKATKSTKSTARKPRASKATGATAKAKTTKKTTTAKSSQTKRTRTAKSSV